MMVLHMICGSIGVWRPLIMGKVDNTYIASLYYKHED